MLLKSSATKKQKSILWLLPLALILLAVAEFAARTFYEESAPPLFIADTNDAKGEWIVNADRNAMISIDPHQRFNIEKEANAFRIFIIGGAATRGIPYGPHIAYPAQLENILGSLHSNRSIEMVNCGAPDMQSSEMLTLAKNILAKHQPDLIIINPGHSERLSAQSGSSFRLLDLTRKMISGEDNSSVLRKDQTLMTPAVQAVSLTSPEVSDYFAANLQELIDHAKQNGVDLLLCNSPLNMNEDSSAEELTRLNEILEAAAESNGTVLVDVRAAFETLASDSSLFHSPIHPTYEGQYVIAREIARTMSQQQMIADEWDWSTAEGDSAYLAMTGITAVDLEIAKYMTWRTFPQVAADGSKLPYRPVSGNNTAQLAAAFVDSLQHDFTAPHITAGTKAMRKKDFSRAIVEFQAALNINPHCDTYNLLGAVHNQLAETAYRMAKNFQAASSHYQQGVKYYQAGLERCPDHIRLNYNLGLLHTMRSDRLDEARALFERVLALAPTHANALGQMAKILIRKKNFDQANQALHRAIDIHPDVADYYTDLGVIAAQQRDYFRAEAWFQKARTLNPKDQQTKYMLNQVRAMMKKIKQIEP